MKIAIDCRYLNMSGIGRYLSGVLENLHPGENTYYGIASKEQSRLLPDFMEPIPCEERPFSAKGLAAFPTKAVNRCDVFFSPNFILPFGIKTRVFTTIHDVVFLDFKDSNNGKIDYLIKKSLLKNAVKRSEKVFTVSEFSKKRILTHFGNAAGKIVVTGNALTEELKKINARTKKQPHTLLYVGNLKKHKGLSVLEKALDILNKNGRRYTLTVAGTRENFRTKDDPRFVNREDVSFTGYLNGQALADAVGQAEFLVQPSFYEGFGITPLEALYFGTKPILSDIEVFKEVYSRFGKDVSFFRTGDAEDLARTILSAESDVSVKREDIDARFSYGRITDKILSEITEGKQ